MSLTLAQIDEKIAALEETKTSILTGKHRRRVGYQQGQVEFGEVKIEDINLELLRLRALKQQLTGTSQGVGPVRFGFGSRS